MQGKKKLEERIRKGGGKERKKEQKRHKKGRMKEGKCRRGEGEGRRKKGESEEKEQAGERRKGERGRRKIGLNGIVPAVVVVVRKIGLNGRSIRSSRSISSINITYKSPSVSTTGAREKA